MLEQKYIANLIKLRDWLIQNKDIVQKHLDFSDFIDTDFHEIDNIRHSTLWGALHNLEYSLGKDEHIPLMYFKSNDCQTNCCLIGWAAVSNQFESKPDDGWDEFADRNFGIDYDFSNDIGGYLFGSKNPPILDDAIERINYVIEHGTVPQEYQDRMNRYSNLMEVL